MQHLFRWMSLAFVAFVFAFLVVPLLVAASVSFTSATFISFPPSGFSWRWYVNVITAASWRSSILETVLIGCLCALVATTVGTLVAYGITRVKRPLPRNALLILFLTPLAVPYVSFGMAIYPVFASYRLVGTEVGVALAQAVIATPFVVLSVVSTTRRRDRVLESAARTLGATPLRCFCYVVLPLLAPGIAAGAILAFMISFDDVVIPIFLGGANVETLPKAMLDALSMSSDPSVMAASTLVSAVGLVALLAAGAVRRHRAA